VALAVLCFARPALDLARSALTGERGAWIVCGCAAGLVLVAWAALTREDGR
jgi:hypothetical protein